MCLLTLFTPFRLWLNPFTWFKPFNVSLRLKLCGFTNSYFQPHVCSTALAALSAGNDFNIQKYYLYLYEETRFHFDFLRGEDQTRPERGGEGLYLKHVQMRREKCRKAISKPPGRLVWAAVVLPSGGAGAAGADLWDGPGDEAGRAGGWSALLLGEPETGPAGGKEGNPVSLSTAYILGLAY